MTETQKVERFIADQLSPSDDGQPGQLAKLVVAHIIKGNKLGDEIRTVVIPEVQPSGEWISGIAGRLVERATQEALSLASGIQRYAVQAFFRVEGAIEDRPRSRHVFVCQGSDEELDQIGTEGPDETGQIAQLQRHTEAAVKLALGHSIQTRRADQEEIARLRQENLELRQQQAADFKMMMEVYGMRREQLSEDRREAVKTKILEDGADKLALLLPIAINHLAGKKVFPEDVASQMLTKAFCESLTKDDISRLGAVLAPEKVAALVNLALTISKPRPETAKDAAAAPASNGVGVTP
jgi:hypothetical protein